MANLGLYAPSGFYGKERDVIVLASTTFAVANTNNFSSVIHVPSYARGFLLGINVTAISGVSAAVTVTGFWASPIDLTRVAMTPAVASAALIATGLVTLLVYPGLTAVANSVFSGVAGSIQQWQFFVSNTTTPSVTLGCSLSWLA